MHVNIKKVITISRRIKISKDIGYKYLSLRYPSSAVLNIGLLLSNEDERRREMVNTF